jgi:hypothetical protein
MRRLLACCVLAAAAAGVAGCGGGSSGGGAPANPQSDPKTTAAAFIAALKTGDVSTVCKYVKFPSTVTGSCPDLIGQAMLGGFTGTATVGNDAISGDRALVSTTGTFSVIGQRVSNTDPNAGLPSGSTTFAQAFATAQGSASSPDLTLVRVNGLWYFQPGTG